MAGRATTKEPTDARDIAYMAVHMLNTHNVQWKNGKAPNPHVMTLIHAAQHKDGLEEPHTHKGDVGLANGDSGFKTVNNYKPKPYDKNGEAADETVICPRCGSGDADDAKYCDQCGFKLMGANGVKVKA